MIICRTRYQTDTFNFPKVFDNDYLIHRSPIELYQLSKYTNKVTFTTDVVRLLDIGLFLCYIIVQSPISY